MGMARLDVVVCCKPWVQTHCKPWMQGIVTVKAISFSRVAVLDIADSAGTVLLR